MEHKEFRGKAAVGLDVLWYANAALTSKPVPAKVFDSHDNGTVDLLVFMPSGINHKMNVHHVSNPTLVHAESGTLTRNAIRTGGWDFTSWSQAEQEMIDSQAEKARKAKEKAKEAAAKEAAKA